MTNHSKLEIKGDLDQRLAEVDPSVLCDFFFSVEDITRADIIDAGLRNYLLAGCREMTGIFIYAVKDGKIRVFHDKDIRQDEDGSFILPSVGLVSAFSIFPSNEVIIACMRACGIIDENNTCFDQSSWHPRFDTEEQAKKFVEDFHEFYACFCLYGHCETSPHLQPLINCIKRHLEHGSVCPHHGVIMEKFMEDPFGFLDANADAEGNCSIDPNYFDVFLLGVKYEWYKIPGTSEWRYNGLSFA